LPDHFVERDGVRAGQINHAVQRFRDDDAGQFERALFDE